MRTQNRTSSQRAGFANGRTLVTLMLLILLGSSGYIFMQAESRTRECIRQLRHIYMALELYELDHGSLPHMAFYPHAPWLDADSMLVVLDPYAITSEIGLCPGAHEVVRYQGLGYIWNANLNGKELQAQDPDTWLVTEINALSEDVPRPHLGRHLVLYADGRVERTRRPPAGLLDIRP